MLQNLPRRSVVGLLALAVLMPIVLVVYQSLLSAPFFMPSARLSLEAYAFVFDDPDFWSAARNTLAVATGMCAIALPLGAILAFLMVRTDLPGRRWLETPLLLPVFVSPVVLGFGYVVSLGPVGFLSVLWSERFGSVPWNVYSLAAIVVIAGLTHVPHVYLYTASALRSLGSDVEEAARITGASPLRVALDVSLPMVRPALLYVGILVFFLGFEIFGLPLILGDSEGHLVLTTYLYKLTNKLGTPSYHLMAAVATLLIAITFPLVLLQRFLLRSAQRFVAVRGKASRQRRLPLGRWRWPALALVLGWLLVTVVVPVAGIALRSVVSSWGQGVDLMQVLTLDHFRAVFDEPTLLRAILNSVLIGTVGGALAVACYLAIGLAGHRRNDALTRLIDYLVLTPRAVPGLMAGLAVFWVFLFVPVLAPLRSTLFSIWFAYTVVWLAYGMRLIQSALMQVGPDLEEAGRVVGASRARVSRDITVPLVKTSLMGAWLLVFMIFEREYATGVYLLAPGTEVLGAQIVSLWASGAVDVVAALSLINMLLVGLGLALARRFGVKLHD